MLSGVLLGDRRLLADSGAEADFRTTGLTHLIAVSGSHLVVVGGLVAWLFGKMRVRRWLAIAAPLAVMTGYVVATGVQASAVRALVMTAIAAGTVGSGRRTDRAAALSVAAGVALVAWPPVAFDLGFALSVASVAGLIVFARLVGAWIESALPRRLSLLSEPLALTVVAQAVTFPIAAPVFGTVSLVAPLANLLVGPLVAAMLVIGLAGLVMSTVSASAGGFILSSAGALAMLSVRIAAVLAAIPQAAVPVGRWGTWAAGAVGLMTLVVWIAWPRPDRAVARLAAAAACLVIAAVAVGPPPPEGARVVVMDVGQGDAILIRDGPHAALIDAGPDADSLRTALARNAVRELEFVAFTHAHEDHVGGVSALQGSYRVGRVMLPASASSDSSDELAARLRAPPVDLIAGQRMSVGSVAVTVLWPRAPVADRGENASSLVLLVEHDGTSVLLTGDAETDVLEPLARAGTLPDVDVLKVGHHGSRVSLSLGVLAALKPETAAISVGAGNRFGHPTRDALRALESAGCVVRRTDLDGDVVIGLGP